MKAKGHFRLLEIEPKNKSGLSAPMLFNCIFGHFDEK